jgi:hypothetical protein
MGYLKYYRDEREKHGEAYDKKLSGERAVTLVYRKLIRHYKLGYKDYTNVYKYPSLFFTSGNRYSRAGNNCTINLDNGGDFGTLCHEVAHMLQLKKWNVDGRRKQRWHNKKHANIVKRMLAYCKKKSWFEIEIAKKLEPKPVKSEPSKEETKRAELEKLKEKMLRYERKINFYQNKLSKANRSYKLRLRHLQT